ncbi:MAG: hypothetical protein ACKV1O_10630 [Saprospiraceae bacterium]
MNAVDYIESGILHDYCLGLLTGEEERAVETVCLAFPEVAKELQLLRGALENYSGSQPIWRKSELRNAVWEAIKKLGEAHP